jgi:hypothetical protein
MLAVATAIHCEAWGNKLQLPIDWQKLQYSFMHFYIHDAADMDAKTCI